MNQRQFVGGVKQTSDVGDNLRFKAGLREARLFYITELGWTEEAFDLVDWKHLDHTLVTKPKMFHVWLCKQASNFAATGRQMGRWFGREYTSCPNCNAPNQRANHLLVCQDPGRTSQFLHNVDKLAKWMSSHTDPELTFFLTQYI
jgi:hypothetical protein